MQAKGDLSTGFAFAKLTKAKLQHESVPTAGCLSFLTCVKFNSSENIAFTKPFQGLKIISEM